ncbi:MAG: FAD:protein FMN transferase [bacterium]|jgi:thiamine biosynthesis lipoprotein
MKRLTALIIIIFLLAGCRTVPRSEYSKYADSFFDVFDTMTTVVGYTKSEAEFIAYYEQIHTRLQELHQLYDIYNNYEGVNNLKTVNDNAGKQPVPVSREIIDLLLFAKEWYGRTGVANIAFGPVLRLWHDYRTEGIDNPLQAKLPPPAALRESARYTDIDKVLVDAEKYTVFLSDSRMRIDVGAVAKGFAAELAAREAAAAGLASGIISAGGNIRLIGKPLDNVREYWNIGIHDPSGPLFSDGENILDTVYVNDAAIVSSGSYQRFYVVDGKIYHHLIDPKTLLPGEYYQAVTVVTGDSGVADFLSTVLFLLPPAESRALAESLPGVEAVWVMPDGTMEVTEGMKKMLKSYGATAAAPGKKEDNLQK